MSRLFSDMNHFVLLLILDLCVPDEGYFRNSLCALDFDIYVFITAHRDSFTFRRDSLLLIVYTYVTHEYHICFFSAWSLVNSSYFFLLSFENWIFGPSLVIVDRLIG
jgi:hypothetical protein